MALAERSRAASRASDQPRQRGGASAGLDRRLRSTDDSSAFERGRPARRAPALRPARAGLLPGAALVLLLGAAGCGPPQASVDGARLPEPPAEHPAAPAALPVAEPAPVRTVAPSRSPTETSAPPLGYQPPDRRSSSVPAGLRQALSRLITARDGTFGVLIEHLPSGQRFAVNADRAFPAASVYKAWLAYLVLREVDRGRIELDDALTIEAEDVTEVEPDSDVALGDEMTVQDALEAMMGPSSNAAAHRLLRAVGRPALNEALAALGLHSTQVPLLVHEDGPPRQVLEPAVAVTTAHDTALLFRRLATEPLLSPGSRQQLWRLLALPEDLDPIAPRLPAEAEVRVKLGNLEDASNAAGLIETPAGTLIVSVFDERVDPGVARAVIADLVELTYRHYSP